MIRLPSGSIVSALACSLESKRVRDYFIVIVIIMWTLEPCAVTKTYDRDRTAVPEF